jgi:hypothetical protein
VPFGFTPTALPSTACTPGGANSTCQLPYLQCNSAQQACTCAGGNDTCYGYCIDTPCGACNKCVASVRTFTELNKANSDAAAVATAWSTFCTSTFQRTPTSCEFVKGRILASKDGNMGQRAGMICQLLQDCAAVPSDCRLQRSVAGSTPAALDLCTVDGTVAGDQVPGVQSTETFTPAAGHCLDASHCGSVPGLVCNKQITTDQNTCSAGVDGVVTVGTCERTPCQTCKVGNCSAPNSNIC